jgi:hypothetical protein
VSPPILSVDCSTRALGWCASSPDGGAPIAGLILLPGMKRLGVLYATVRNSLSDLVDEHRTAVLVWCRPMYRDAQTAAQALLGVAAIADLVAYDAGIRAFEVVESSARKDVLGRGSFGERDARGRIIKGTGSKAAKAAALEWCARHGFRTDSDDVADACVLHEHVRRVLAAGERMCGRHGQAAAE